MVRLIYSLIFIFALPLVLFRLIHRSIKSPAYRRRIPERFGGNAVPKLDECIWIHAVSVGETVAAEPLVHALLARNPQQKIVITTTTPTGSDRVLHLFAAHINQRVYHCYLPYDIPLLLTPLIKKIQPTALLIMETELWPNLITVASRHADVVLLNARLSSRSFQGYRKANKYTAGFITATLNKLNLIMCSDEDSQARFAQLGFTGTLVHSGNIKFDGLITKQSQQKIARPTWVAGSTHAGEEEILITAHKHIQTKHRDALLILAPRHPERFQQIADLLTAEGMAFQRSSELHSGAESKGSENAMSTITAPVINTATQVVLIDEMGVLLSWYARSHIAFVGGSLQPIGGHNVLEPMMMDIPVITGPYYKNFQSIINALLAVNGIKVAEDGGALTQQLLDFFSERDGDECSEAGVYTQQVEQANAFIASQQGVLKRIMAQLGTQNI